MKTLYRWTSSNMSGWEFLLLTDNGEDGSYFTGNSASTTVNTVSADVTVHVKKRADLKDIAMRLDWLGKYTNKGRQ